MKMKQAEIAEFYGVNVGDVSRAFQKARLEPMHWDLENASECLYDLYMDNYDKAMAKACYWKDKASEMQRKWSSVRKT